MGSPHLLLKCTEVVCGQKIRSICNSSPLMVYTTLNSTTEQARANLTSISAQGRFLDLLLMLQPQISLDHAWDKWVTEIAWHSITSAFSQTMIIVEAEHFEGHWWHVTRMAEVFVVRLWPESNPQTLKTCVFQSRGSLLCTIALSHLYHRLNLLVIYSKRQQKYNIWCVYFCLAFKIDLSKWIKIKSNDVLSSSLLWVGYLTCFFHHIHTDRRKVSFYVMPSGQKGAIILVYVHHFL